MVALNSSRCRARSQTMPGRGDPLSTQSGRYPDWVKIAYAPAIVSDTPEVAVLVSRREALVHAHCHCTAEIGRVVSTPRCFWWIPTLETGNESGVAVEFEGGEPEESFVEGWCPTHHVRRVAARELLVHARRAQKTGQRRHMWLE